MDSQDWAIWRGILYGLAITFGVAILLGVVIWSCTVERVIHYENHRYPSAQETPR